MKRRARRPPPPAKPSGRRRMAAEIARTAMAHQPATPTGEKVKLTLTIFLPRALAETLAAQAIREGRNLAALVAEILEREERGQTQPARRVSERSRR